MARRARLDPFRGWADHAELIQQEAERLQTVYSRPVDWKAALMCEYPDVEERREALARLARVAPVAYEDLDAATERRPL